MGTTNLSYFRLMFFMHLNTQIIYARQEEFNQGLLLYRTGEDKREYQEFEEKVVKLGVERIKE